MGNGGRAKNRQMLTITEAPKEPIQARQTFAIAGTASPEDAGKTLTLTIDNRFTTSAGVVNPDGAWRFEFAFQQPGNRLLKLSLEDQSVELTIQVVPPPVPLSFVRTPKVVETQEIVVLFGRTSGYADGSELVLLADKKYELARPRVKDGQWEAPVLFNQTGKRLIEIIGSGQDRAQFELSVQRQTIRVWSRSIWTLDITPAEVEDLEPQRITFHHTEYPNLPINASQSAEVERLRQIRRFHVDPPPAGRGWSDIGYHFVIMPSGRVYEARSQLKRGAHDKVNDGLGIAFDGNYTSQTITQAQFQSAVALCAKLFRRYGLGDPVTPVPTPTADFGIKNLPLICGHRDRVQTTCPGSAAGRTIRLEEIRRAVKSRL
ncbi:MAG TPA: N-acetylmuramoyl-L-alanine amidase [Cyanobacteria bacterium UBA11369]|nr:N-acetylmuramoyl-L-alanine amidase [Cyanobacteria bacterium UBA11371]HBE36531.1 N-acetylmuramoyl-L-alanine amidase [Cyanobacteria bacterium UBA11368]HBE47385.1 N-acetylmuramoyl-L-alanine amidase [Cyanobacteria bacterium UBA11369]